MRSTAGLPFLLEEGDQVAFVPPQTDIPRDAVVEDVRMIDDFSADIAFVGIDSLNLAEPLVGCHCLIRRDLLDESVFRESLVMWEGWTVEDDEIGFVGTVSGYVENPMQSLLEVERSDGSTTLVPVVDEIVRDVDIDRGIVKVSLPAGLLDL